MKQKKRWAMIWFVEVSCMFNFGRMIHQYLRYTPSEEKKPSTAMLRDGPSSMAKKNKSARRVVFLLMDDDHEKFLQDPADDTLYYWDLPPPGPPEVAETLRDFEKDWFEKCEPSLDLPIRPTCNSIHELDFRHDFIPNVLSMDGSWRSVLRVNNDPTTILKVLHLHRVFDEESFQKHEMDNGVMEQLTASPYIVSSHGFCGQSVVTPLAKSSGKTLIKNKTLRKIERLRLARDLARGLAELHAMQRIDFDQPLPLNNESMPLYFAHHDINIANTISVDPKSIVWNDFNLGIVSKHYPTKSPSSKQQQCEVPIRYKGDLWRSPEEILNATNGCLPEMQSSDVYSFGNILYHIMVRHQPWTHLEDPPEPELTHVADQKLQGYLPNLPPSYESKYVQLKVIQKAYEACFRLDPAQRPSALHLAQAFQIAHDWVEGGKTKIDDERIEELFAIDSQSKLPYKR
eukprot:scaffold4335_cov119-Cylindrotheca_fusiformis.AAC.7